MFTVALAEGEGAAQPWRLDQNARADTWNTEGQAEAEGDPSIENVQRRNPCCGQEVRPNLCLDIRQHRTADLDPTSAAELAGIGEEVVSEIEARRRNDARSRAMAARDEEAGTAFRGLGRFQAKSAQQ